MTSICKLIGTATACGDLVHRHLSYSQIALTHFLCICVGPFGVYESFILEIYIPDCIDSA